MVSIFWINALRKLEAGDEEQKYNVLQEIRKKVATFNPPIEDLVSSGLVPVLVNALENSSTRIQHEAIWCLINVAFAPSNLSVSIFEAGAVPKLLRLMKSENIPVASQSTWVLSNLCGESSDFRDRIIADGAVDVLCDLLWKPVSDVSFAQTLVWLALNISRQSNIPLGVVEMLTPPLLKLFETDDRKILVDTCWFFTNLIKSDHPFPNYTLSIIFKNFKLLFDKQNDFVIDAALQFVSAVVTKRHILGSHLSSNADLLPKIILLMAHKKQAISHSAAMTCRWLTASVSHHIQALLDAGLVAQLIQLLEDVNTPWKVKQEVLLMLDNISYNSPSAQINEVYGNLQLLSAISNQLKSSNIKVVKKCLSLIYEVKDLPYRSIHLDAVDFEENLKACKLDENLKNLLDHTSDEIHTSALELLQEIYPDQV